MANAVAALYTSLTLESSQFIANAKRTATATERMSNDISRSLTVAKSAVQGFLVTAGAALLTTGVRNALDYASAIGETAQQLGVATDAYQELTYAATQQGVAQQELEAGLSRLTRNIGEGAAVFAKMGVAIRDAQGNSRETGAVFKDVADKLAAIKDPAKRAALEVELFGRAGQKLDTLLSGGSAALGEMADEARRLGMVLSPEQIRNADNAADAFAKVKKTLEVNIASAVSDNATAILGLANALGEVIRVGGSAASSVRRFYQDATIFAGDTAAMLPWTSDRVKKANADFKAQATQERLNSVLPAFNANLGKSGKGAASRENPADTLGKVAKAAPAATKAVYDFTAAIDGMQKQTVSFAGDGGPLALFATDDQIYNETVSRFTTLGDLSKMVQPVELIDEQQLERVQKFGESLSSNLGTALVYGQSLGDALVNSIKAAAAEAISSGLFSILTGGGGGGIIGAITSAFGGFRASGGPVSANKAYVVGERGPEILTGASGRVIPNGYGGGGGVTVNVDARGATDPAAVRLAALTAVAEAAPALLAAARGETIGKLRRPVLAGGRG